MRKVCFPYLLVLKIHHRGQRGHREDGPEKAATKDTEKKDFRRSPQRVRRHREKGCEGENHGDTEDAEKQKAASIGFSDVVVGSYITANVPIFTMRSRSSLAP